VLQPLISDVVQNERGSERFPVVAILGVDVGDAFHRLRDSCAWS